MILTGRPQDPQSPITINGGAFEPMTIIFNFALNKSPENYNGTQTPKK